MYGTTKLDLLRMFIDRTAGESTTENRLITREGDNGVELIGYGWLKIADYDEARNIITVYTGHKALNSVTVNTWLNDVLRVAEDTNRSVVLSGASPTVDTPNEGVKFIGNYVSFEGSHSPVEEAAVETVTEELQAPA